MPTRFLLVLATTAIALPATAPAAARAHAAGSAVPVARYSASPSRPIVGEQVSFDASSSTCSRCSYLWEDDGPDGAGGMQWRLGTGAVLRFRFSDSGRKLVRLTVSDGGGRTSSVRKTITVTPSAPAPPPPPPPTPAPTPAPAPAPAPGVLAQPSCETGAVQAATAGQVRSALAAGADVCVTASVGDVDLDGLTAAEVRYVGTTGAGSIGRISLHDSSRITLRARLRSIDIRFSNMITIERSIIGGTSRSRVMDQLIFIPERSDDVTIRDNDIGWTTADDSGNTGYAIRAYRDSARLRIERNLIHHIGADGIQLGMDGVDTLIDRNEIAYVAPPASSNEHSDDIQITGNGPNMRITNNYLHHNGWLTASGPFGGGSGPYIHAGGSAPLVFENNLVRDERNYMQVGNLGTGGCVRSNLTFRRNTLVGNGTMWQGAADLYWRLCGGSGNVYDRNVVNDTFWNEFGFAASATAAHDDLTGTAYAIDADGDCTVAACNPVGQEPIGYRKPPGVHW